MRVVKINAIWCSGCLVMNKIWKNINKKYNIEEKYGSVNLLVMFLITACVTALYNIIFKNYKICGASDNVFMLIMLSSFSNISEGKIPLTLILIALFYVTKEIKDSIFEGNKKVSHESHILGALCGLIFGFYFK